MIDVFARLQAPDLGSRLELLGFRPDDAAALLQVAQTVLASGADLERLAILTERLLQVIGNIGPGRPIDPWDHEAARDEHYGTGVLPMLALLLSVDEVRAFHAKRGVPDDISWCSLSDLGQQAWVHRQTYGEFGLHTYDWLSIAWSGALYWLGRLQFNLQLEDGQWVLSSHIPQAGPLTPASVDDSLARAEQFFGRHFADYPVSQFYCCSWLLDPQLADVLDPDSNMIRFLRRWTRYGEPIPGDQDAIFFTFRRRGDVDLGTLPRRTSLERAIVDHLQAGGHWNLWRGRLPLAQREQ